MYKDLFFDLDHTLWDFEQNSRVTLQEAFVRFGIEEIMDISFEDFLVVYEEVNALLWDRYRAGQISREFLRNHRFELVLSHWGISEKNLSDALSDYYVSHSPRKVALVDGTLEVLDYLKGNYRMHIITNGFNEVQFTKMSSSGLSEYFQHVITSENAGANKPSQSIFLHAMEIAGSSRNSSLMIGDHYEADIRGAALFGMDQVWYNPDRKIESGPSPTYVIYSLRELMNFL